MAEEKEDKKAAKQAAREAKKKAKEDKKKQKQTKDGTDEEEETVGGKFLIIVVAIFIIFVWLLILGLLIKMDVGGFGSTVLYPVLKDVPVVNQILPDVTDYAEEDEAYAYDSVDDAVQRIKELEQELADAKTSSDDSNAYIAELEAQAAELKTYKENEAAFEEEKEKFYNEVVFSDEAPDISSYKEYYESIDPENAEVIYKQVVEQLQEDEEISDYAATYSNMKPAQAAAIFNTMGNNLPLVGKILWAMDAQSRANILGAMDTDIAAAVTKLMEP
jgi:flagellar motility protein MotE (MotC chaperone)